MVTMSNEIANMNTLNCLFQIQGTNRIVTIIVIIALYGWSMIDARSAIAQLADKSFSEQVSAVVERQIESHGLAGVAVSIVENGEIKFAKAFGFADAASPSKRRLACDTPFQLASLSKQFASTSVMLLVNDGKLSLDDSIGKHLQGLPAGWEKITVKQLLAHTSGIEDYVEFPNIRADYQKDLTRAEILKRVYSHPLEFQPGEKFEYSNSGYIMVGCLIESVSGINYGTFLQQRIFKPLDMRTARLEPTQNDDPSRAIGHESVNGKFSRATYNSPNWAFAAGGIVASLNDLARWDAAIDGNKLLNRDQQEALWENQSINGKKTGFGLGWMVRPGPDNKRFVLHFGGKPGFSTAMARLVEDRLTIIVMSNVSQGRSSQILDQIGRLALAK